MKHADFNSSSVFDSLIEKVECRNPELLARNTIFVASSRLTRKLDAIPEFFESLLTLATQLDPQTDVLITADGTSCDRFVRRIGELFSIPVLDFFVAKTTAKFSEMVGSTGSRPHEAFEAFVLPKPKVGVDELLAALAKQMVVLSVRAKGNLERAVWSRLDRGESTRLLICETLTKRSLIEKLLDAGARGWYLFSEPSSEVEQRQLLAEIVTADAVDASEFLLHWTRRRTGPWPQQSHSGYLDELIFGCSEKERGELAVLRRILATGRILASNDLTRDARRVVCFSDMGFQELTERRVFRPHLSRWDFEPFGFAISKSWLQEQGARQVIYGDEQVWESLEDQDRPFFQLNRDSSKVDWSQEAEWRFIGDLDLRKVPVDRAAVFVPTVEDANQIAAFSRWPVVVLIERG